MVVGMPVRNSRSARFSVPAYLACLVILTLGFLTLRRRVYAFVVVGTSMEPALHPGQGLLVDCLTYPSLRRPRRGDIVVFRLAGPSDRAVIKRVAGTPGQKVEIRGGRIFVDDEECVDHAHVRLQDTSSSGPAIVPPHHYFLLGDNRGRSQDSRSWGFIPRKSIVGKVAISYWPPERWGRVR